MPLQSDHSRRRPSMDSLFFLSLALSLVWPTAAWSTEPAPPVHAEVVSGHSGMWYDPSRSGEGWMLEVLPNDEAVVYWFTFDDQGNPRWLNGLGQVHRGANGDEIRFDDLIAVHGPRFGPDYDREDAVIEHVGQARFRFLDCDRGEVEFDAYGQQGGFPLVHLTHTMGAKGCRPIHGTPGEPVQAYAGQSGSWYDPTYSGQGFTLGWMPNGDAALVWFTFDAHGQPYWLTGVGTPSEDRIVFDQLLSVRGGRFAEDFNPATVTRTPWGRMELTLECEVGQAHYVPTEPGFAEGQFNLHRLTRLESPNCPWVKPKLSDLYDFEWTELPIPLPISPLPNEDAKFEITSLTDDGTVIGTANWYGWRGVVRLRPGETQWEKLLEGGGDPFITPDGKAIYAYRVVPAPPEETRRSKYQQLMIWREGSGWQPLSGTIYPYNEIGGMSQNGQWIVGQGFPINGSLWHAWKWSEATGQVPLLEGEVSHGSTPIGISNDGNIGFGYTLQFRGHWPFAVAIRWEADAPSQIMRDSQVADLEMGELFSASACDADCRLIVGFGVSRPEAELPRPDSAWYYTDYDQVVYLPYPANEPSAFAMGADTINQSGDLIAGTYLAPDPLRPIDLAEAFLWSEDTSTVSLRDILGQFPLTHRWERNRVKMSPNGKWLLVTGGTRPTDARPQYRAGILRLIPKATSSISSIR